MVVYKHSLYSFELIENESILLFNWTGATAQMTEEDYQEALHNYAGFELEFKTPSLLVDVRNFQYTMTPELSTWRDEHISPRYRKAEIKKFGYIVPQGVLEKMKGGTQKVERGFEEEYFEDRQKAIDWLLRI
ncbi:MAG: STAS/SEC14 domain-containing protein [Cyclobacteriaceae bacterium]